MTACNARKRGILQCCQTGQQDHHIPNESSLHQLPFHGQEDRLPMAHELSQGHWVDHENHKILPNGLFKPKRLVKVQIEISFLAKKRCKP